MAQFVRNRVDDIISDFTHERILKAIDEYQNDGVGIAPSYVTFQGIDTMVNIEVDPHPKFPGTNVLELVFSDWNVNKNTIGIGISNNQRSGTVRISPIVMCVPYNIVVGQLLHRLTSGAVDKIIFAKLSYNKNDATNKQTVQSLTEFQSCNIIRVDPDYHDHFSTIVFTAAAVEKIIMDFKVHSENGAVELTGQRVTRIDTNAGTSTLT